MTSTQQHFFKYHPYSIENQKRHINKLAIINKAIQEINTLIEQKQAIVNNPDIKMKLEDTFKYSTYNELDLLDGPLQKAIKSFREFQQSLYDIDIYKEKVNILYQKQQMTTCQILITKHPFDNGKFVLEELKNLYNGDALVDGVHNASVEYIKIGNFKTAEFFFNWLLRNNIGTIKKEEIHEHVRMLRSFKEKINSDHIEDNPRPQQAFSSVECIIENVD